MGPIFGKPQCSRADTKVFCGGGSAEGKSSTGAKSKIFRELSAKRGDRFFRRKESLFVESAELSGRSFYGRPRALIDKLCAGPGLYRIARSRDA